MTERLFLEGKNFITVADAIVRSGYAHNHITRLCREGRLEGKKIGMSWYVGEDSLEELLVRPETLVEDGKRYVLAAEAAKTIGYARDYVLELCREDRIDAKKVNDSWMVEEDSIKRFFLEQQRMRLIRDSELAKTRREARVHGSSDQAGSVLRNGAMVIAAPKELSQYRSPRKNNSGVRSVAVLAVVVCMLVNGYRVADAYRNGTFAMPALPIADELLASAAVTDVVTPLRDLLGSAFWRALSSAQDFADVFFGTSTVAYQRGVVSVKVTTSPAIAPSSPPSLTSTSLGVPITQPIIERIRESVQQITVGGISEETLAASLQQLDNKLSSQIANVTASGNAIYQVVAQSNRIDQLTGTTLNNITVNGISGLAASDIPTLSYFAATSTISIAYGGTGTSTLPTYGKMLIGNSNGTYDLVATSTLGISGGSSQWTTSGSDIYYNTGNVGIGSSTPLYKLSVEGTSSLGNQALAGYFNATTTTASIFPYASTTMISATTASTTNLIISGVTGGLLKTSSTGVVSIATLGTDYVTGAGLAAAYPFTLAGNATSTLTQFNGGLTAYASSTIGDGTQAGGLTVSGGATTTGNAYFAGNVGIGTTSPGNLLDVGSAALGVLTGKAMTVSNTAGNSVYGFGQDTSNRGRLSWIYNATPANAYMILGDAFGTHSLVLQDIGGNVGIGTTTPWAQLSINPTTANGTAPSFVIGSSTATNFIVTNAGNVGVGTTTPAFKFDLYTSDGGVALGDITAGTASTDSGLIMTGNGTSTSALFTEVDGKILSYGINVPQITTRDTATAGGIFRFDTRTSNTFGSGHSFIIKRYAEGSSTEVNAFSINLNTGDTVLAPTTGLVGIGTSTPWGKLSINNWTTDTAGQPLFVVASSTATATTTAFIITNTGNVGIGTTSPFRGLSLTGAVSTAQQAIAYDTSNNTDILTSSTGDYFVYPSGNDALFNNSNLWVCTGGSSNTNGCPSGTPNGQGNLIVETALGVGSSTPWTAIAVGANGSITTTEKALSDGTTITINWKEGNQQVVTLGGNRTVAFTNQSPGMTLRLVLCQDATGSRTITWPGGATLLWSGGAAPTLTTTANKCDVMTFLTSAGTSTPKVLGSSILSF